MCLKVVNRRKGSVIAMIDQIAKRASVRRFKDEPVSVEAVTELLRAAMAAPSGGNQQPWEFYVVRDADVRAQLAAASPYAKRAATAPIVIVPCMRENVPLPECAPVDMSAAIENLLLECVNQGLGGVWMAIEGYPDRIEGVRTALDIPSDLTPFALAPCGIPDGEANAQGPSRFDASRVHER